MNQYKKASFIKLVLRFTLSFFVIVTLLRLFTGVFRFDGFLGVKQAYLIEGKWQPFLQTQLIFSVIYGLFMAGYYKFIKK